MNDIAAEKVLEIANELNGTCLSIEEVAGRHGIADTEQLGQRIEEQGEIVRCEQCGWWDEASVMDEENVCADCRA